MTGTRGAIQAARVRIRPVVASELDRFRQLRLRALAESPSAFGSTYEEEAQRPLSAWERWRTDGAVFVAEDEGEWTGLVAALVDRDDPEAIFVLSMWVDPQRRGAGIGRRLLDAAVDHARQQQAQRVGLGVVEGNERATKLYEAAGFRKTGRREPLASDRSRTVVYLQLELDSRQSAWSRNDGT